MSAQAHQVLGAVLAVLFILGCFVGLILAAWSIRRAARRGREESERIASQAFERHRERGDL